MKDAPVYHICGQKREPRETLDDASADCFMAVPWYRATSHTGAATGICGAIQGSAGNCRLQAVGALPFL